MGGLVASYWAAGGTEEETFRSDDTDFLRDRIHSIILLDSPVDGTLDVPFFGKLGRNPRSSCDSWGQSWNDLVGSSPVVPTILEKNGEQSNVLTNRVNIVHVNSTVIGDILPGYWRKQAPPCTPRSKLRISKHTCMLDQDEQLRAALAAISTELYDDRDKDVATAGEWKSDFSRQSKDGWVRGRTLYSNDRNSASVRVENVRGEVIRVLYTGYGSAKLLVDGREVATLPGQKRNCKKYFAGHGKLTQPLCQFEHPLAAGSHTVEIETVPNCPRSCRRFYFDALEVAPRPR